jgi:molybdenum cofactor synthesis domain-containing protein
MAAVRETESPTAAVLVVGDEILSGRTKDRNIGYIADYLAALGIDLLEARIVPDREESIVDALDALRSRYTYVFTTGGIGPTHDDITADAVARAFGVPLRHDPRAVAMLRERFSESDLNKARLRMARIPEGGELIPNAATKAPGFRIGNVIVLAGVPSIMQAMLDTVGPSLQAGVRMQVVSIEARLREGDVGGPLAEVARRHPGVLIGSYPHFDGVSFKTALVLRSRDGLALAAAEADVRTMVEALLSEAGEAR